MALGPCSCLPQLLPITSCLLPITSCLISTHTFDVSWHRPLGALMSVWRFYVGTELGRHPCHPKPAPMLHRPPPQVAPLSCPPPPTHTHQYHWSFVVSCLRKYEPCVWLSPELSELRPLPPTNNLRELFLSFPGYPSPLHV